MKILNKMDIYNNNLGENLKLERKVLLEHSCVFLVKLKCAFQTGSKIYLVMEYLSGGSLASFLNRMKRFNEDLACFYASEIVLGYLNFFKYLNF